MNFSLSANMSGFCSDSHIWYTAHGKLDIRVQHTCIYLVKFFKKLLEACNLTTQVMYSAVFHKNACK